MRAKYIIMAVVLLLFLGVTGTLGYLYQHERKRTDALREQLHELDETAKRAVIERNVSAQMEEIANEQKAVSDEQREAANEQARIASEMRAQSELERQRAVEAREDAEVSEKLAVMASLEAEEQQKLAEKRQKQAEAARRLADTLGYQSLARSLGSASVMQWNLGNRELASMPPIILPTVIMQILISLPSTKPCCWSQTVVSSGLWDEASSRRWHVTK